MILLPLPHNQHVQLSLKNTNCVWKNSQPTIPVLLWIWHSCRHYAVSSQRLKTLLGSKPHGKVGFSQEAKDASLQRIPVASQFLQLEFYIQGEEHTGPACKGPYALWRWSVSLVFNATK